MRRNNLKIGAMCIGGMLFLLAETNWMSEIRTGTAAFGGMMARAEDAAVSDSLEDDLIEDSGEEMADNSGAKLEELKAAERRESEAAAQKESEEKALEEARAAAEFRLAKADAQRLGEHLEKLTEAESPTGSDGELICAAYIKEIMEQYGFTLSEQSFHEGFLNENGIDAPGINIIAERGADAQKRRDDIFIVAAHYDSKTNPEEGDPFANDKTGAAVLLETARILSEVDTASDLCFVFFSGEEDGGYGSREFVNFIQEEYAHRVSGVLYVERGGYDTEELYLLKTPDGEENEIGNLLKNSAMADLMEAAEEEREETVWIWTADTQTPQYRFAEGGMTAVTVCQDVTGMYKEDTLSETEASGKEEAEHAERLMEDEKEEQDREERSFEIDPEKLAELTDLLSSVIWEEIREH